MDKKEMAAQKFKERTASKRFKLPEGNTTFRVLPNQRGLDRAEYIEYAMHSEVGARKAYLRCGKKNPKEGACWICDELIPKLLKTGKSSHKSLAETLKRKECFAVQIAYKLEGKWVGPTLWEMSTGIANKLLNVMSRRDVSHPQKGYNLTISRVGTTKTNTKYGDIDRDDDKSEVDEKILEKLQPFGEVLRKYDEAAQKTEYYGHDQEEDDTPEEDEKPAKKKPVEEDDETEEKPAKKPLKKPVDEEEEEEEEKPAKKPAKKPVEEDEPVEEEDDVPDLEEEEETSEPAEEEEDEKPKVKKKPKPAEETEEEEEEAPPKKKKKPVVEDDDE